MPIQFRCGQCERQLKVGDEHAGKKAKCPSCQTINSIPMANSPGGNDPGDFGEVGGPSASSPTDSNGNPYSDPMKDSLHPSAANNPYGAPSVATKSSHQAVAGGDIVPTPVDFEQVWTPAWQCWSANLGLMVGCIATIFGICLVFLVVLAIFGAMLETMNSDAILIGFMFCVVIAGVIFASYTQIGMIRICVRLLRRQQTGYADLFSGADKVFPATVAGFIFFVLFMIGYVPCVIPSMFVMLLLWPYIYLIADNKAGIADSFSIAFKIGSINKLTCFVLFLVGFGLSIAGQLACYVGVLFSTGLICMLHASAYLKMTGQLR